MDTKKVFDIVGIGIGPFNLGLAALADGIGELDCAFVDKEQGFDWHPGMMIAGAKLQVPFYADLVTLADPCSKFSFLNYLKEQKRLFRFAIHENNFISRREYNDYCRWVAGQLKSLHFAYCCDGVYYNALTKVYEVMITNIQTGSVDVLKGKHVVIGVGTIPSVPECASSFTNPMVFHSADYLKNKDAVLDKKSVCIIGSGQSAAELFYDLLNAAETSIEKLDWFTRSERFFPMEYSKLSLEMTSPDYIDHFFGLGERQKTETLRKQDMLYKGINFSLINEIYDCLYERQFETELYKPGLYTNCELHALSSLNNNQVKVGFLHTEMEESFSVVADVVILATGYKQHLPFGIESAEGAITGKFSINRNYSINVSQDIFVQNADLYSHGFTSPDLGMGSYRNGVILNAILGIEHFEMETKIAFQTFGVP